MRKVKLHEVADVVISNVDKKSKDGQKTIHLCNFVDVYYNWAITEHMQKDLMVATASDSEIQKFQVHKGQVALTKDSETRDDIGIPTYIADEMADVVLGYHCALITPHDGEIDGRFLNAYLNSSNSKRYFANNASGSGQRYTLSLDTLRDIQIFLPDIDEQIRIGKIFSSIDSMIALNQRINQKLEQTIRRIYDYWFVQFDFPDIKGKPYNSCGGDMIYNDVLKRAIPAGWEVSCLGKVSNITNGATPRTTEPKNYGGKIIWITPDDLSKQGVKFTYKSARTITQVGYDSCSTHMMPPGTILLSSRAPIGLLSITKVPLCTNQGFKSLVPNNMAYSNYLYYYVQTNINIIKKMGTGSTFAEVSKNDLYPFPVLIPNVQIIETFNNSIEDILDRQYNCLLEIDKLTSLRDRLLPLLMNGQVKIAE